MPNWKKVIVSGSDAMLGNITASNISSSGELYFSSSLDSNTNYKTVVVDTSTGKLFHTGSYSSGGGGSTPTLQQVTNQGASTTNNVEITGSLFVKGNENVQTFNPNSTTALEIDSIDGSTNDAILIRDNGFERARIGLAMGGKEGFISLQNNSGPSIQFRSDKGEPNFIKPKLHLGGSSGASEQLQVTGNAKITGSLIISGSIDMALKSGPAFTITEMDSYENSNKIFEVNASGAMDVNGSIRSNFTSCNFEYNNNQLTEITKSFSTGNTEKTEIVYTGENLSTINVIGTDGVSTLYTIEYNGNNISGVTVT